MNMRNNYRFHDLSTTLLPGGMQKGASVARRERSFLELSIARNTEMPEGRQIKRSTVISTFHCFPLSLFCFYIFKWKIIFMNVFNHGTEKRCLARVAQYLEAVKIYVHSPNICNPQWSFGFGFCFCLPVKTQESGNFPSKQQWKAII